MTVSLPMYPLPGLRAATEALWRCAAEVAGIDEPLEPWTADVDALWNDPALTVTQTCGWPLVTSLAGKVRVVGAFSYRIGQWHGWRYRSVLLSNTWRSGAGLSDATAAVNSTSSLSGWISLLAAVPGFRGPTVLTGSHVDSLTALQDGRAELASIDALTLAHTRRLSPGLTAGLREVGSGPVVPTLPLVTAANASDGLVDALRAGFAHAARQDPATLLLIDGFHPLDADAYDGLRHLEPAA